MQFYRVAGRQGARFWDDDAKRDSLASAEGRESIPTGVPSRAPIVRDQKTSRQKDFKIVEVERS